MLITQCALAHVGQLDGALRASVHEPVAADGMKLGSGNDLGQFLHVGWFDVDNVEALILDVEIPQVDAEIITADEGLAVTVDGDAVDVVGVSICIGSSRDGGYDSVVVSHSRQLQLRRALE